MGSVIVLYKILPDSPDNFDKVKQSLEAMKPEKIEEEAIGFGVKSIKFYKFIGDEPGEEEKLETEVKSIEHVETVETVSVTRSI